MYNFKKDFAFKRQNKSKKEKFFNIVKNIIIFCICMGLIVSSVAISILLGWYKSLPDTDTNILKQIPQSSNIYDINGNELTVFSDIEHRQWIGIEDIPRQFLDAFIATEDVRFYNHHGVDFKRFVSATLGQLSGSEHGGSTMTQQLVKNVYLNGEITYKRKFQEIFIALDIEKKMTKDEILEAYVNMIYMGGSNYGIKSASRDYFAKEVDELSLREMAMIAGLTKNPNGFSPRNNMGDMSKTNDRTDTVLFLMNKNGYISDEEYENALNDTLIIADVPKVSSTHYDDAHFIEYVISEVIFDLMESQDIPPTRENYFNLEYQIRNGGYTIYTTMDSDIQHTLQTTVSEWGNYPSASKIDDKTGKVLYTEDKPEVAAVIIENGTGNIVAMIGSRDEPVAKKTLNRAVSNNMPVASSIKPLSTFAPAFEAGASVGDITYNFRSKVDGYDNNIDYPGGKVVEESPITIRDSIAYSYNIPTARVLCNHVGYEKSYDYMARMGISPSSIQMNGSGLVLGTSGINVLELTGAYTVFPNNGVYIEPKSYTKVLDSSGNVVLSRENIKNVPVFKESTVQMTTSALGSVTEYGSGVLAKGDKMQFVGKTGTSDEYRSLTFAGYSPYYTSAIWMGSDNYIPLNVSAGSEAYVAPLWGKYMNIIHKDLEAKNIHEKTLEEVGLVKFDICKVSGGAYCDECGEDSKYTDIFHSDNLPKPCDIHGKNVGKGYCSITGLKNSGYCPPAKEGILMLPKTSKMYMEVGEKKLKEVYGNNIVFINNSGICNIHGKPVQNDVQEKLKENIPSNDSKVNSDDLTTLYSSASSLREDFRSLLLRDDINDSETSEINLSIRSLDKIIKDCENDKVDKSNYYKHLDTVNSLTNIYVSY